MLWNDFLPTEMATKNTNHFLLLSYRQPATRPFALLRKQGSNTGRKGEGYASNYGQQYLDGRTVDPSRSGPACLQYQFDHSHCFYHVLCDGLSRYFQRIDRSPSYPVVLGPIGLDLTRTRGQAQTFRAGTSNVSVRLFLRRNHGIAHFHPSRTA